MVKVWVRARSGCVPHRRSILVGADLRQSVDTALSTVAAPSGIEIEVGAQRGLSDGQMSQRCVEHHEAYCILGERSAEKMRSGVGEQREPRRVPHRSDAHPLPFTPHRVSVIASF